jgi:hypothetical protein
MFHQNKSRNSKKMSGIIIKPPDGEICLGGKTLIHIEYGFQR